MTQENQRLIAFATAVGADIKALNARLDALANGSAESVATQIQHAITALHNELMGGEVDAQLDTLKELGERLKSLDESQISGAILQKFSEIRQQLQQLTQQQEAHNDTLTQLNQTDFLTIYQQAKGQNQ